MSKVCLYHGADLDGISSAAIIKYKYPETCLYPMDYDVPFDLDSVIEEGDDIYIVDFTLSPFSKMVELSKKYNLIWIDHHDTSIRDHEEYVRSGGEPIEGIRSTDKAACELTWEYIFPETRTPYSIWLLGRYDVWDQQSSESITPFQYGMLLGYQSPNSRMFWDNVFTANRDGSFIQNMISSGKTIIKYREKLNKALCKGQSFKSELEGHSCVCINRALCGSSVFDSVWNPDEYDMMLVFYICNRGLWNVSLYTDKEGVHVGNIAKKYGGGGHEGAAGFSCKILPFDLPG